MADAAGFGASGLTFCVLRFWYLSQPPGTRMRLIRSIPWTATADSILAKIEHLSKVIDGTPHQVVRNYRLR
jgi:hypothetical protein